MMGAMPAPTSVFVGRDGDVSAIATAIGLDGGTTNAVVLAGDAGVGKTRVLQALRDAAVSQGWLAALGHCLDLGDHALPYLPFTEVLTRLHALKPDLVDEVLEAWPALERLRPGRRLLDSEALEAGDWTVLFDAVHSALDQIAGDQPLLVIVEDAHWADKSTRDLLTVLLTRPFTHRVAIVASYRSDDLHRRHPLRPVVAQWGRLPNVVRLQLDPLKPGDVREMAQQLHRGPLSTQAVDGIVERAEGNAFFAEELIRMADATGGIPETLADLLMVRVEQLSADALEVLRVMAAIGRRASHDMLSVGVDLPPDRLNSALREALEHHVVVPSGEDGYRFRHALLAEAVYDDLLPGERRRLHHKLMQALIDGGVQGTAAELARHARAAGDLLAAVEASKRAGDDAMAIGGPTEAVRNYEAALEILADAELRARSDVDAVEVVTSYSAALVAAGDLDKALRFGNEVLNSMPATITDFNKARLLVSLAGTALLVDSDTDPLALTREALDLLGDEPTPTRARALHWLARVLGFAEHNQIAQAQDAAVEALGLAEQLNLPRLASDIHTTLAGLEQNEGDDIDPTLVRAAAAAAKAGAATAELRALTILGRVRMERGEFAAAEEAFDHAVRRAIATGRTWAPYGFDARFHRIQVSFVSGDWAKADELLAQPRVGAQTLQLSMLAAAELQLVVGRGAEPSASLAASARERWQLDGMCAMTAAPEFITLAGRAGRMVEVESTYSETLSVLEPAWGRLFAGRVRLAAVTVTALSTGLDLLGAPQRAARLALIQEVAEPAFEAAARAHDLLWAWGPEGIAWERRLKFEVARCKWLGGEPGDPVDLERLGRQDVQGFTAWPHVLEGAASRLRLGEVLVSLGVQEGKDLIAQARETGERLGARWLTAGPVRRDELVLTRRELEVLRLVAAGRSNGEIAKQLFIATKTASVHVSNILAKLGAAGRTEAAAIAREKGLLGG